MFDDVSKGTRQKNVENSTLESDPPLRTKVWKIFDFFQVEKNGLKWLKMAQNGLKGILNTTYLLFF